MFWNYLTIIYICWETSTDMKTHIIALFLGQRKNLRDS